MFRSGMIALIYEKTLVLKDIVDTSGAVAMMSSDVDQISSVLEEINEVWTRVVEICIGLPLLARQLGWVSIVPVIVVISKSQSSAQTNQPMCSFLTTSSPLLWCICNIEAHSQSPKTMERRHPETPYNHCLYAFRHDRSENDRPK